MGNGIAATLKKRSGQTVEIEGRPFRIAGIFQATNPFDANSIVASLAEVQKLMERPRVVSEIQVRVADRLRNQDALNRVCSSIEELRDEQDQPLGLKAQRTQQFVDSATEATLGKAMAWATTAIVLVAFAGGHAEYDADVGDGADAGVGDFAGDRLATFAGNPHDLGGESRDQLDRGRLWAGASWLLLHLLSYWPRTSLLVPQGLSETAMITASWPR